MAKTICVKDKKTGKEYMLEFTRRSASVLEQNGFELDGVTKKPMTMIPMLFRGAFLARHSGTKGETIERIFEALRGRGELIKALCEMYYDAYATLLDEPEDGDEGNEGWKIVE